MKKEMALADGETIDDLKTAGEDEGSERSVREVLQALEQGAISVDDAVAMLE